MTEQLIPPQPEVSLRDLLAVTLNVTESGVQYVHAALDAARYDEAARLLAQAVADRRIRSERLLAVWRDHALGGNSDAIDSRDERVLRACLLENVGTPASPAPDEHLHGFVAECLWVETIEHVAIGPGSLIRVEAHDWSSTDPGGDGLTVYRQPNGFAFRLWESKYHGASEPVRDTVSLACRQIQRQALKYLARFSLVEQQITDDPLLASFYVQLPELWANRDAASGVGIAVGAAGADGDDFDRVSGYFGLEDTQHQGHLSLVGDFPSFASKVRELLWAGCGSWNEP